MEVSKKELRLILEGLNEEDVEQIAKELKKRKTKTKSLVDIVLSLPNGTKKNDVTQVLKATNHLLRKRLMQDLPSFDYVNNIVASFDEASEIDPSKTRQYITLGYMLTLSLDEKLRSVGEKLFTESIKLLNNSDVLQQEVTNSDPHDSEQVVSNVPGVQQTIEESASKHYEKKLKKVNRELEQLKLKVRKLEEELQTKKSDLNKIKEECSRLQNKNKRAEISTLEMEREIERLKVQLSEGRTTEPNVPSVSHNSQDNTHGKNKQFADFRGGKVLVFAPYNETLEHWLENLNISALWASTIDWNRPRNKMTRCKLVIYEMDESQLAKLDLIRDIARNLKIPCYQMSECI